MGMIDDFHTLALLRHTDPLFFTSLYLFLDTYRQISRYDLCYTYLHISCYTTFADTPASLHLQGGFCAYSNKRHVFLLLGNR